MRKIFLILSVITIFNCATTSKSSSDQVMTSAQSPDGVGKDLSKSIENQKYDFNTSILSEDSSCVVWHTFDEFNEIDQDEVYQKWGEYKTFKNNNIEIPYRLFSAEDGDKKIPLVIFLPGSDEAYSKNEERKDRQLYFKKNIGPDYFISESAQDIQKAYVLAPQIPEDILDWSNESLSIPKNSINSSAMDSLISLIDKIIQENPNIDSKRVYLSGLSLGGITTFYLASKYPDKFSAIAPMAGGGIAEDADKLKNIPIWAFSGTNDDVVFPQASTTLLDKISKSGNKNINLTFIKEGDHCSSWLSAFNSHDLWNWLIKQSK